MRHRRIWDQDDEHVQASFGPVFYTRTIGVAKSANIRTMVANLNSFVRESEGQVAYILHLGENSTPPDGEDRPKVWDMFNRSAARLAGVAIVIDAKGFKGSMIRSTVTMAFSISRRGYESSIVEDMIKASSWIGPRVSMSQSEILALAGDAASVLLKRP